MDTQLSIWHLVLSAVGILIVITGAWINIKEQITKFATKIEYLEKDISKHDTDMQDIREKIDCIFKQLTEIKVLIAGKNN